MHSITSISTDIATFMRLFFPPPPPAEDSARISLELELDNGQRRDAFATTGSGPGWDGSADWFEVRTRFCCCLGVR